ncbi:efflux RND transporter permease subunit [Rhodobacteraceae bacterium B1Z28]|uniref:Efflux RND transporter permease subunit n=1 Tax=Ruegeria haliotis TaxID=2747601 RepID=A0ABX2PT49_9RHOB|nr:efflux RND transporter permease subunit [Ruegeria haliotis]NVO57342.1 efflux RND transporter permease subunit [Ruegeria haliotis]
MADPKSRGLIGWFIRNPIAANLLMMTILVLGWFSLTEIRREGFPKLPPSQVKIELIYDSGSAQETEEAITIKIEAALSRVKGIRRISSRSTAVGSFFSVEKETSTDIDRLIAEIRTEIDALTFPAEAERAQITRDVWIEDVLNVQIAGDVDHETLSETAFRLRQALLARPEITSLSTAGEWHPERIIEVSPEAMQRYDLTRADLAATLRNYLQDAPQGRIETTTGPIVVSTVETAPTLEDLRALPVKTGTAGQVITLGQIAEIRKDYETPKALKRFDDEPALRLTVEMGAASDIIAAARATRETVESFANSPGMPQGVTLHIWNDQSQFIEDRLSLLKKNGLQGALLVALILALFLHPRVALWVALGLPVSFAGALILMGPAFFDFTLNDLTTFGFIVALGLVVDDAIVVGESVSDTIAARGPGTRAVYAGVKAVNMPTIVGMLTTIAAFYPITVIDGDLARVLAQFSTIVIFTLLFSMVETKLILPAHLVDTGLGRSRRIWRSLTTVSEHCTQALRWVATRIYRPCLQQALRLRYISLLLMFGILAGSLLAVSNGVVRQAFFPDIPLRVLTVTYVAEPDLGQTLFQHEVSRIARIGTRLQRELKAASGKDVITAVELDALDRRATILAELSADANAGQILAQWQKRTGAIEGARELSFTDSFGSFPDFSVEISTADRAALQKISSDVIQQLQAVPGVTLAESSLDASQPQVQLHMTPLGETLGLEVEDIAQQIEGLLDGIEITTFMHQNKEISVTLTTPETSRQTAGDIGQLEVVTSNGQRVKLKSVVKLSTGFIAQEINRNGQGRVVTLSASVDHAVTNGFALRETFNSRILPPILSAYPDVQVAYFGETEAEEDASIGLLQAFGMALLIIFGLLAAALRSYLQSALILMVVPFGLVGAIWGHWLHDLPLSILSANGIVALAGVIVNNGLLLVVTYNATDKTSRTMDALMNTGTNRFRAVVLTSMTTFFGLAPLLYETSEQAQFLIPAAVSIAYGMLFATLITLFLVPVLLFISQDLKWLIQKISRIESRNVRVGG